MKRKLFIAIVLMAGISMVVLAQGPAGLGPPPENSYAVPIYIASGTSATTGGLCFKDSLTSCFWNNSGNINMNGASSFGFQVGGAGQFVMDGTVLRDNSSQSSWNRSTGLISAKALASNTNCKAVGSAANPSIAACGSAIAGMFSCSTSATAGTCQVNTTAVTANSEVLIIQDDADGGSGQLNVTCNTAVTLPAAAPTLAAKSTGASFTINLGTVSVNPACYEYMIVN